MSVANGREFLSIPGPTNIPDAVLQAMHRPAIDIYHGPLVEITDSCLSDLKTIFNTKGDAYIYIANGHGAWEAALSNVLNRGDKVLVLESGLFAAGWGLMAEKLGIEIETLPGSWHAAVDPAKLQARLTEDTTGEIKAIMVVQIDTASGVVNDIAALRQAIDDAKHPALYMVDTIASLATMPYDMDGWGVDISVSGAQKGLMTPPGISFVAANGRAKEQHKTADLVTSYWDWTFRDGEVHYMKYCGTPPEHHLFALRKALDMLLEEELENVFERHRLLANATRAAVSKWASGGNALSFNIAEQDQRANSVTTIQLADSRHPDELRGYCREKCGVVIGNGIGEIEDTAFRIAHMGHVNAPMVLGTLAAVEMGLQALNIPHGKGGVQAAIDYLATNVPA
jgi:alanine-glyoxylate transaminase / serine-glyoxylate transaminase / serine-pyruvate transaminase